MIRASCSRSTAVKYFCTRNLLSSSNTCALENKTRRFDFDALEAILVAFEAHLAKIEYHVYIYIYITQSASFIARHLQD